MKAAPVTEIAEPAAPPQPVVAAPAQTRQVAVEPEPEKNVIRISSAPRKDVERYLENSESFGARRRSASSRSNGADRAALLGCP